jgi:hypothetical protein
MEVPTGRRGSVDAGFSLRGCSALRPVDIVAFFLLPSFSFVPLGTSALRAFVPDGTNFGLRPRARRNERQQNKFFFIQKIIRFILRF